MALSQQALDFSAPPAIEPVVSGRVVLGNGPWGITWLRKDAIVTADNPVMFTCVFCGTTSSGQSPAHSPACRHPGLLVA